MNKKNVIVTVPRIGSNHKLVFSLVWTSDFIMDLKPIYLVGI